eukprot:CAMPEP_0170156348 /NCGR_PEP_ID=MMETSP0033_2-20121228/62914_1 /TAXON_ID=195969 /ORGANISM="Dolichomastix tenuilepis, Strain CCMP3274" /LENGTH=190 /DNA_ID=CAMNT_0010393699 /DNA_START=96 /DNA_END=668 /DNA_ORIENTATION=+
MQRLDFGLMKERLGAPPSADILAHVASLSPEERATATATIEEMEREAMLQMEAMHGAEDLLRWIDSRGIRRGLLTRNNATVVEHMHTQLWRDIGPFEPALSRERPEFVKPSPGGIHHCLSVWGVAAEEVVMIGDSAKDDVVAGARAGVTTVLLLSDARSAPLEGEQKPTHVVENLAQVPALLESCFDLLE